MNNEQPLVTITFPAFNADKYVASSIQSLLDQTFTNFELIISDNASIDTTERICREFAEKDERIRYVRNPVNIGVNGNFCNLLALSRGEYLLLAADHDLWRPDILEHYLEAFKDHPEIVLVYSPATIIAATGEIIRVHKPDTPQNVGKFSTFFNVFFGGISSSAVCGLFRKDALLKTSIHTSLGPDTLLLAELSLYGEFHQLPESNYFRRQNRPPESPQESAKRYIATLFENPPEVIKVMPYAHMVYKALCMVQNNDLSFEDQRILNEYILLVFTRSWGVTCDRIVDLFFYMNYSDQKSVRGNTPPPQTAQNRQKPERMVLEMDTFLKTMQNGPYAEIVEKYNARMGSSMDHKKNNYTMAKKWKTDKQYDVCYLLYDASKWGGVKGTIAQANGLVDLGYRVCIVCRTVKPDWIDIKTDYIISANLSGSDIPSSDIIIGTWYPTIPPGFSSKKGICVHYCRGYEASAPGLTSGQISQIQNVYKLSTVKIANSSHVAIFLKNNFSGDVYVVRNDIDHSIFHPDRKLGWGEGTIKMLIVGPYEVAWKGIRDCLEACGIFYKLHEIPIEVIRVSQTPEKEEEKKLAHDLGFPYEYRFNLSEREMAALYNECDILLSGSYPYVESFGRPAMEALACGLPTVLTDIPAYRDFDQKHDYALFVEPGNIQAMAEMMYKIVKDSDLREQLVRRGIEVSSKYSLEQTINDLDRTLQDIYRKNVSGDNAVGVDNRYYGFSRPEVQAMVDPKAGKILDVGCAAGQMGVELKARLGAEVWGIEIVEGAALVADKKLDRVIHGSIEEAIPTIPDNYFDTIILADVLEHLYDPYAILKKIQTKLTSNGQVVASIPNIRHWSVVKELLEGRWDYKDAGILDRTHLRFFTKASVISLFHNAGFEIKELKATTLRGSEVPSDVIEALAGTAIDISTLKEEGNHYQYLVRAVVQKVRNHIVSLIILTFNQLEYTKKCIASIRKHTPEDHEILFIDNGSTDGTVKWLRKLVGENSNYRLIENSKNLGFAKGCNQGIEASRGEYILLLNNDVVVTEGWLSGMVECLTSAPDIGITGPMTNNISGPQQVVSEEYRSVNYLDKFAVQFRKKYRHRRIPQRRIVGFCMLFRRSLAKQIGLLDENFGTGNFEDDDYCMRATLAGFRNMIAGDVFIHHYGSRSFIGNKIDYSRQMSGNSKIFDEKWREIDINTPLGRQVSAFNIIQNADILNQRGQLDKAIAVYIEGIKYSPDEKAVYYALSEMLIDAKLYKDALDTIQSLPAPNEGEDLKRLEIMAYCKEGLADKAEESVELAERILAMDPDNPAALNLKGMMAHKSGNRKDAEDFFSRAITADPGYGDPFTNLGVMKWAAGSKEEALDLLERGFILSPTLTDNANFYHTALTELEQFSRAEGLFRDAKELHPENKRILFLLIDILIHQGKFDKAMVEIERAMLSMGGDEGMIEAALAIRAKVGDKQIDRAAKNRGSLSLCMIVKNEERHLARCLLSASPVADEMIVVDTGSTDRTKDIAAVFGARVSDFTWTDDFSEARNFSLSQASGDWILVLDADEVISPLDYAAIEKIVRKKPDRPVAYVMRTRNYTDSVNSKGWVANDRKYLREEAGTGWFPSDKVRLFVNDPRVRFENPVHEFVEGTLEKAGIESKFSEIPVHHYGRFDTDRIAQKGKEYFLLGKKKIEEKKGDIKAMKELAVQAAELGEFDTALELWKSVIALDDKDPMAFLNIGFVYMKQKNYSEALVVSRRALELDPTIKEAVLNYAGCEFVIGDIKKTISLMDALLKQDSYYPPAMLLLAAAYYLDGQKEKAIAIFDKLRKKGFNCSGFFNDEALDFVSQGRLDRAVLLLESAAKTGNINEDAAVIFYTIGEAFKGKGQVEEAIASFRKAVLIKPDFSEAHYNLGCVLNRRGWHEEAIACYKEALRHNPGLAEAHYNMGIAFHEQGSLEEAMACYRAALQQNPSLAEPYINMGLIQQQKGESGAAMESFQQAIRLDPGSAKAWCNLGILQKSEKQFDEARDCFVRAIGLDADLAEAHWNLATVLLIKGDYEQGWQEYEWRSRVRGLEGIHGRYEQPLWRGEDITGKTILIHAEQGMGDTLQFIRYIALVAERGARVVVEGQRDLARLLNRVEGVHAFIPRGTPLPAFDLQCPLLSLPYVFGTKLETIPGRGPYIPVDEHLFQRWRDKIGASQGNVRVGLAWSGNPRHESDRERSVSFGLFSRFADLRNVEFFSFQKGPASVEARNLPAGMRLFDYSGELDDFADTAALAAHMDLMVSVDTAVVHLAGALGKEVWVLLSHTPDWRWMLDRKDTPWYPAMRLFRQPSEGGWEGTIDRVHDEMKRFIDGHAGASMP